MIVSITRYTTRLALRVRNLVNGGQIKSWQELQLIIAPSEDRYANCCHQGGSPWFLTGCWPFHPTGVDLANPKPFDFPAIVLDAFDADADGRIVFLLDKRFHLLPDGRYIGILRVHPHTPPINLQPREAPRDPCEPLMPPGFYDMGGAQVRYSEEKRLKPCKPGLHPPHRPHHCCNLAVFDIDLGPECAQHMIDQCAVDLERDFCGEEV